MNNIKYIVIDLFCGAGGTTTGFDLANWIGQKVAIVISCVNHDAIAIKSHWQNHQEVEHFNEDITELYGKVHAGFLHKSTKMVRLVRMVDIYRALYPDAKVILWASLECTNFSKAKGGMAREADSRTLADHLDRYILAIDPDYVQIENVVEFMSWGPLDLNGKPISRKNGSDWMRWRTHINNLGYRDDWRELNSADFGAYTSRNRLFGCFAKPDMPIVWPEPTHAKNPSKGGLFGDLKKWKAVRDCLDLESQGESIFGRKKPLVDKTLQRIYAGLVKFVANGEDLFLQKYFSGRPMGKVISTEGPCGTITTSANTSLVIPSFILKYNSMSEKGKHNPPGVDEPCPVVACQNRLGVVNTEFLYKYYGNGHNLQDPNMPSGTITTKDRLCKVFIDQQYGNSKPSSIDNPAGALTGNPKLASCYIDRNFSQGGGKHVDVKGPIGAIMTVPKANLVSTECGSYTIEILPEDSETMVKIKIFMVVYGISDIKMRMLFVSELLKIQGFPPNYKLAGTQTDQKKFIGNSVVPQVVKAWAEAMANYQENQLQAA